MLDNRAAASYVAQFFPTVAVGGKSTVGWCIWGRGWIYRPLIYMFWWKPIGFILKTVLWTIPAALILTETGRIWSEVITGWPIRTSVNSSGRNMWNWWRKAMPNLVAIAAVVFGLAKDRCSVSARQRGRVKLIGTQVFESDVARLLHLDIHKERSEQSQPMMWEGLKEWDPLRISHVNQNKYLLLRQVILVVSWYFAVYINRGSAQQ